MYLLKDFNLSQLLYLMVLFYSFLKYVPINFICCTIDRCCKVQGNVETFDEFGWASRLPKNWCRELILWEVKSGVALICCIDEEVLIERIDCSIDVETFFTEVFCVMLWEPEKYVWSWFLRIVSY